MKPAQPMTRAVDQETVDEIARVKMQLAARVVGSRGIDTRFSTTLHACPTCVCMDQIL